MSTTIWLNGDRFKIPRLIVKFEKKSTILLTLPEIARTVSRSPQSILQYFTSRLGGGCATIDKKNDKYGLYGHHSTSTLQSILQDFIQNLVLWPGCKKLETRAVSYTHLTLPTIYSV